MQSQGHPHPAIDFVYMGIGGAVLIDHLSPANQNRFKLTPETGIRTSQVHEPGESRLNWHKGKKKDDLRWYASRQKVEAGGIEPPSRDIFMQASTCVVANLVFGPRGRPATYFPKASAATFFRPRRICMGGDDPDLATDFWA